MSSRRCSRRFVSALSVGTSVVAGDASAQAESPARDASCAAARGGTTAPWDVQNAAAEAWSCTVRTRSESASCALPSWHRRPGYSQQVGRKVGRVEGFRTLPMRMASSGASSAAYGARRA
jgi:hypothetical protein